MCISHKFKVMLILLVQGPYFEKHWGKVCEGSLHVEAQRKTGPGCQMRQLQATPRAA